MIIQTERRRIIDSGSSLQHTTSLSQRNLSRQRAIEGKALDNTNVKAKKAQERRRKARELIKRRQFERALGNLYDGNFTSEELFFIARHIGDYERALDTNNGFEATIVDFSRTEVE